MSADIFFGMAAGAAFLGACVWGFYIIPDRDFARSLHGGWWWLGALMRFVAIIVLAATGLIGVLMAGSIIHNNSRSLLRAFQTGEIRRTMGKTVYRRTEPGKFWRIVVWQAAVAFFVAAICLLLFVGLAVYLFQRWN